MKAWFLSDIHLKENTERNSQILLRFLHFLATDSKTTHLFLLGDIFDLWVGDSNVFYLKFKEIVLALSALQQKGVQVIYFEGNHDVHVVDFWQKKYQIPVRVDAETFQLGSHKVRVEHGDFINPDDLAYKRYLKILRSRPLAILAKIIPGLWIDGFGRWASKKSRQKSHVYRRDSEDVLRSRIRKYAESEIQRLNGDFQFLITGHMHVRDEYHFVFNNKSVSSINLGSWFEKPMTYWIDESQSGWKELN